MDAMTATFLRVLNVLLLGHPNKTSLGVVVGLAISGVIRIFAPALTAGDYVDLASTPWWAWVAIGVVLAHLRTLWRFWTHAPTHSEKIDEAMMVIEEGNFSAPERRQHYRRLVNKVIDEVKLNSDAAKEISALERAASKDVERG